MNEHGNEGGSDSSDGSEGGMEGDLAAFPLFDMMRWLHTSRRSVVMRVTTGGAPAWLFFRDGSLYRAEWSTRAGVEAVMALIGVRTGSFWLSKRPVSGGTRNVDIPTAELLDACGATLAGADPNADAA